MNIHHMPIRRRAGLVALLLPLLAACSPLTVPDETAPPAETQAQASSEDALRTYYESMIAELKEALLEAKESDYISRTEYESRIAALEAELAALNRAPVDSDIPVSGDPDVPPTETSAGTDAPTPPASMAFHYRIEDGGAVIYEYLGSESQVVIPERIGDYPVTRIADNAFRGTAVRSVVVPSTVTAIGWFAFADCRSLTSVTLPASVTSIDYGAFDGSPYVTLYCPRDSYAARFATSFGMKVRYV